SSFQARWPFLKRGEQRSLYKMRSEPIEAAGEPGRALLAIGDVHGHLDHLDALLGLLEPRILDHRKAGLQPLLVMLGDYIDRGPANVGTLRRIQALTGSPLAEVRALR